MFTSQFKDNLTEGMPQVVSDSGQESVQEAAESRLARKGYFYLGLSLFCLVLFLVYNLFSHGVHSPYMTYLFLWPLLMGAVPSFLAGLLPEAYLPGRHEWNLYFCGVEALTMASLLKGILDIAGTASVWQKYLMGAGSFLAIAGTLAWLARQTRLRQATL